MSTGNITLAGASWCGYTVKAQTDINASEHKDQFNLLNCDKDDKDNPLCKSTNAFPTFYNSQGEVCHTGYAPTGEIISSCTQAEK